MASRIAVKLLVFVFCYTVGNVAGHTAGDIVPERTDGALVCVVVCKGLTLFLLVRAAAHRLLTTQGHSGAHMSAWRSTGSRQGDRGTVGTMTVIGCLEVRVWNMWSPWAYRLMLLCNIWDHLS